MDPRRGGGLVLLSLSTLLFTLFQPTAFAQWHDGRKLYRVDKWTSEQGLPQHTVDAITQTRDGYLWIGTRFGLARFDGIRFTPFTKDRPPAMKSDACLCLAEDQEGTLWIGTDGGLLSYRHGKFTSHPLGDGPGPEKIWSLCADPAGGIWIGGEFSLSLYSHGQFQHHRIADLPQSQIQRVYPDGPNRLLTRVGDVGYHFFNTKNHTFSTASPPGAPPQPWEYALSQSDRNRRWIAVNDGLYLLNTNRPSHFIDPTDGLPDDGITLMFEDSQGALWIAARDSGLLRYHDGTFSRFDIGNKPHNHSVSCIYEDSENNIWVGTDGDGLYRLQRRRLTAYSTPDGIAAPQVWSVWPRAQGGVWVGSRGGINSIVDQTVQPYDSINNLGLVAIRSVYEAQDGTLWIGSHIRGLRLLRDGQLIIPPDHDPLGQIEDIRALYQDRDGDMWIAHNQGVLRHGSTNRNYSTLDGLSSNDIRVMLQDQDGSLWLGSYENGLCRLQNNRISCHNLSDNSVWALHQDGAGTLWIGTANGLIRLKDGRFSTLTTKQGLQENIINHIIEDDQGRIWLSGLQGIYHIDLSQLNRVADGRMERVHCVAYGIADGMLSSETNGEHQPAGCKDPEGRLWFPTTKGVVVISPDHVQDNRITPPIIIESVRIDDEYFPTYDQSGPVTLPPGRARVVQIRFTANSLTAPTKVKFKYRLRGHHDDWQDAHQNRVAYFTTLRPGDYRFEVLAANNHDYWTKLPATFAFTLQPHFYQMPVFYVACAVGAIAVLALVIHIRFRILKKIYQLQNQHSVDVERSRIARDLHDELGSSLTRISLLSELALRNQAQPAETNPHIETISHVTAGLFNSLDELIWAADPSHDTLEGLINHISKYARDFLRTGAIHCRLEIPKQIPHQTLPAEVRHHLFLVVKEALNNVAKHSGATEVWIHAQLEPSSLRLIIEDNGTGIDPSSRATPLPGNGLPNMQSRIKSLKGRLDIGINPLGGTSITIVIDLHAP